MTDAVAPWRLHLASTIVGLLAIGLGVTTWIGVPGSTDQTSTSGMGIDTTSVTPRTSGATVGSVTTLTSRNEDEEVRRALKDALVAWGVFAGSGDLGDVGPFFDPNGPQWASLSAEAGSIGNGFTAEIVERSLESSSGSTLFEGDITLASIGETRLVSWTIELRQAPDGQWRIWAVSDTAP